jgi:hypothetical protein
LAKSGCKKICVFELVSDTIYPLTQAKDNVYGLSISRDYAKYLFSLFINEVEWFFGVITACDKFLTVKVIPKVVDYFFGAYFMHARLALIAFAPIKIKSC